VSDEDRKAMQGIGILTALVSVVMFVIVVMLFITTQWTTDAHLQQALTGTGRALAIVGAVFAFGSVAAFAAARRE
jgi:uncharacterized membrane protein